MMRNSLSALILLTVVATATGQGMMRREPKRNKGRSGGLQASLQKVIGAVPADRLFAVEESIRPTYEAFPKNAQGQIPPKEIFPAIVRNYFAKEHGWLIKGLEPPTLLAPKATLLTQSRVLQDRAPELLDTLKRIQDAEQGLALSDVVGVIAALEEALLGESDKLLQGAYYLNGASYQIDDKISEAVLHEVLQSYLLLYRHGLPVNLTDVEAHKRWKAHAHQSVGWPQLVEFESGAAAMGSPSKTGEYSFNTVSQIVKDITRKYGKFQDSECQEMKGTLMELDKTGRGSVLYEDFHAEPAHPSYQFTETEEYLRKAGAELEDEHEVMIANYILGPSNCIASSTYYSVCCLNECERILSDFEEKTQSPVNSPEKILELLQTIGSSSRPAPQPSTSELEEALRATAELHEGYVVLHSADFKKWLHLAFPSECPKPTSPESVLEESELVEAQEWLDNQKECTRLQSWHPALQRLQVSNDGAAAIFDV